MPKLKRPEKNSLFEIKREEDCDYIEITDELNNQTGDSTNMYESTEFISAKNEADDFVNNYVAKTPSDYTEVNDKTLIHYFGKNWDGTFPDCSKVLTRRTSIAATQLRWYDSIFDYITTPSLCPAGMTKYANFISQIYGTYDTVTNSIRGVNTAITNLKNFKFSTENPMAILNSTDYALANLEYMFTEVDKAVDVCVDLYNKGEKIVNNIVQKVEKFMDFNNIEDLATQIGNKIKAVASDIAQNLANLPGTLLNKFLNCSFVQNMFTLPLRVYGYVASAVATISSIRMPTNLKSVIAIFGTLRKAVAEMKNAVSVITNAINQVKQVANMIKQGNWYGMLGMLNTKGSMNGFKMVEKPSSFAAKYPQNSAYTTAGGHTLEIDNTTGHERIHVEHKSGTSFEMATSGDLIGKVKKDMQTVIDGDCEISTKGNVHLQANKKLELTFAELKIDTSKDVNFTGSNITMSGGLLPTNFTNINGSNVLIQSTMASTLSSVMTTNVSGVAGVEISSNGVISINAPQLLINCLDISVTSLGPGIQIGTSTFIMLSGGVTYVSGSNNHIVGGLNNFQAGVTKIGGL